MTANKESSYKNQIDESNPARPYLRKQSMVFVKKHCRTLIVQIEPEIEYNSDFNKNDSFWFSVWLTTINLNSTRKQVFTVYVYSCTRADSKHEADSGQTLVFPVKNLWDMSVTL